MKWQELKKAIYFEDGSLRDIYIENFNRADWIKWIQLVNEKYSIQFYNGVTEKTEDKIDVEAVLDFWSGKTDLTNSVRILFSGFTIACYFFDEFELENDIDPREFHSIEQHQELINYLLTIESLLEKPVSLTLENSKEIPFIEIRKAQITFK